MTRARRARSKLGLRELVQVEPQRRRRAHVPRAGLVVLRLRLDSCHLRLQLPQQLHDVAG